MEAPVNTSGQTLQAEAAKFFDAFVKAFRSFDGKTVSARYATPYLALNGKGALTLLPTQEEIARYFQTVLDNYFAQGCRSCRYLELEVLAVGSQSAIGTVTWELLDQNDKVLSNWRESYNFMRTEHGLQIFASTDHASWDDQPAPPPKYACASDPSANNDCAVPSATTRPDART